MKVTKTVLVCCLIVLALTATAAGQSLDTIAARRQWLTAQVVARGGGSPLILNHARLALGRDMDEAHKFYESVKIEFKPGPDNRPGEGWHDFDSIKLLKALLDFEHSKLSPQAVANMKSQFARWQVADPRLAKDSDRVARWPVIFTENHDIMHLTAGYWREIFAGRATREHVRQLAQWMDWRLERGFYEWHSPQYAVYTLNALLIIARHAPDETLRARAAALINAQIAERALLSLGGFMGGPYLRGIGWVNNVERDRFHEVMWTAFGLGKRPEGVTNLFPLDDFTPHPVVAALTHEWRERKTMSYRGSRHYRDEEGNYSEGNRRVPVTYYNTPHVSLGSMNLRGFAYQSRGFNVLFAANPAQTLLTHLDAEPRPAKCATDKNCLSYEVAQHRNWLISRGRLVENDGLKPARKGAWNLYRVGQGLCAHAELLGGWHVFQVGDLEQYASEGDFIKALSVPVINGDKVTGKTSSGETIAVALARMELSINGESQLAGDWRRWLHDHPALRSVYGSGRIEIMTKAGKLTLDKQGLHAAAQTTAKQSAKLPRLRVSDNRRFLVTAEGQPFFWLGDTAWGLVQKSRPAEDDKQPAIARYFEQRAAQGFNVLQTRLVGGDSSTNVYGAAFVNNHFATPRLVDGPDNDYWDHADYVVELAERHGIYLALLPIWGNSVGKEHAMLKDVSIAYRYGHFVGARYRDKPHIIWVLGGDALRDGLKEADPVWPPMIRAMAEGIADGVNKVDKFDGKADYATTLMTYHPRGSGHSSAIYLHDEAWLDFNMLQTTSRFDFKNYEYITRDYARQPAKPVLDAEVAYEYSISLRSAERAKVGEKRLSPWEVRKAAYWAVFAGGFGHTYGHRSFISWTRAGETLHNGADVPWFKSLAAPGALQMLYLKRLLESRPFLSRVPDQSLLAEAQEQNLEYAQATRGDGYALVYLPTGKTVTINLSKIAKGKIAASWFDPRTGKAEKIGVFDATKTQTFTPPTKGEGQDWVLVLDAVGGIGS